VSEARPRVLLRSALGRDALPWPPLSERCLSAVALLSGALLAVLSADALRAPRAPFDLGLLRAVQDVPIGPAEHLVRAVDTVAASFWSNLLVVVTLAGAVTARRWFMALVVATIPVGRFLNYQLGEAIGRPRPSAAEVERVITTTVASFPSGHVIGATLFYGLLLVVARGIPARLPRLIAQGACMVVLVTVGYARLWFGAHWPTDVLGGYALGTCFLALVLLASQRLAAWVDRGGAHSGH
jgi:undecaprenyl-diphosphatase